MKPIDNLIGKQYIAQIDLTKCFCITCSKIIDTKTCFSKRHHIQTELISLRHSPEIKIVEEVKEIEDTKIKIVKEN